MAATILLADDSPTIGKILSLALAQENYRITAVDNAADAERQLLASPPDFFLVDIALPEKDGLELTRIVRSHPALSQVKVVLLANAHDPIDRKVCDEAGADAVIVKPFDPAQLRKQLNQLAEGTSPRLSPQTPPVNQEPPPPMVEQTAASADELVNLLEPDDEPSKHTAPDVVDLSDELKDWKPVEIEEELSHSLSQWSSRGVPPSFDIADSSFRFSDDYMNRVTDMYGETPVPVRHYSTDAPPGPSGQPALEEVRGGGGHMVQLSKADMEQVALIIRDEVKRMLPELVEKVIKKELDTVMKALDP